MWWGGRICLGNVCVEGKVKYGRYFKFIINKEYKYLFDYVVIIRNRVMIVEIFLKLKIILN